MKYIVLNINTLNIKNITKNILPTFITKNNFLKIGFIKNNKILIKKFLKNKKNTLNYNEITLNNLLKIKNIVLFISFNGCPNSLLKKYLYIINKKILQYKKYKIDKIKNIKK